MHAALWFQDFFALLKNRLGFRRLCVLEYATELLGILQQGNRTFSNSFHRLLVKAEHALFTEFAADGLRALGLPMASNARRCDHLSTRRRLLAIASATF